MFWLFRDVFAFWETFDIWLFWQKNTPLPCAAFFTYGRVNFCHSEMVRRQASAGQVTKCSSERARRRAENFVKITTQGRRMRRGEERNTTDVESGKRRYSGRGQSRKFSPAARTFRWSRNLINSPFLLSGKRARAPREREKESREAENGRRFTTFVDLRSRPSLPPPLSRRKILPR